MAAGRLNFNAKDATVNPPPAFRNVVKQTAAVPTTTATTSRNSNEGSSSKVLNQQSAEEKGGVAAPAPADEEVNLPRKSPAKPNIAAVLARDQYNATRHRHIENLTAALDAEEVGSNSSSKKTGNNQDAIINNSGGGDESLAKPTQITVRRTTLELANDIVVDVDESSTRSGSGDYEEDGFEGDDDDEEEHGAWELVAVRTALSIATSSPNNRGYKEAIREVTIGDGSIGLTFSSFAILPDNERAQAEKLGGHAGVVRRHIHLLSLSVFVACMCFVLLPSFLFSRFFFFFTKGL